MAAHFFIAGANQWHFLRQQVYRRRQLCVEFSTCQFKFTTHYYHVFSLLISLWRWRSHRQPTVTSTGGCGTRVWQPHSSGDRPQGRAHSWPISWIHLLDTADGENQSEANINTINAAISLIRGAIVLSKANA